MTDQHDDCKDPDPICRKCHGDGEYRVPNNWPELPDVWKECECGGR